MSPALSLEKLEFGWGELTFCTGGSGKPLLVIPDMYDTVDFGALASCCQVFVPTLPGFGQSAELAGEHSNNKLAWAMLKFADAIKLEKFDLLAHKMGSAVASEMIRRRPAAINKLVLIEPFVAIKLLETLPTVMLIKHFLGKAPFSPRSGREWLLDSARYDVRKSLGKRLETALVMSEGTVEVAKPVCEYLND